MNRDNSRGMSQECAALFPTPYTRFSYSSGVTRKVRFLVAALPHSDAIFVKAYPAETAEALCDGHVAAFAFFGGVPGFVKLTGFTPKYR